MEYNDSQQSQEVAERTNEFIQEEVLPVEREYLGNGPVSQNVIDDLRERAREYDVYGPQIPEEYGGLGMDFRDVLPVFEAAGRSLLGPPALRIKAPDEGNIHTFEIAATPEQKDRWLDPLARGDIDSAFSMTEPTQGGGSDPKMINTTAELDDGEWVINGHKWWITNADNADLFLVMARTDLDKHPYSGCSILIVPSDTDGVEIEREIPHLGQSIVSETHCEVIYDDVRIPEENVLGGVNEGFTVAQQRLGPARLTHCMRFSGMALRSLDIAKAFMSEREVFGEKLAEKQGLRFEIAEAETELHAVRTMVRHAASQVTTGEQARIPVSMTKYKASQVTGGVIDLALQACGSNGMSKDLPLADFYQWVRGFRVFDGPDEVHKRTIARDAFEDVDTSELENLTRYRDELHR